MSDTRVLENDCGICGGDVWSCKCAASRPEADTVSVPLEELRELQKYVLGIYGTAHLPMLDIITRWLREESTNV